MWELVSHEARELFSSFFTDGMGKVWPLLDQPTRRDQPTISASGWGPDFLSLCCRTRRAHDTCGGSKGPSMPPHENSRRASGTGRGLQCSRQNRVTEGSKPPGPVQPPSHTHTASQSPGNFRRRRRCTSKHVADMPQSESRRCRPPLPVCWPAFVSSSLIIRMAAGSPVQNGARNP